MMKERKKFIRRIVGLFFICTVLCLFVITLHACQGVYRKLDRKHDEIIFGLKYVAEHDYQKEKILGKTSVEIMHLYGAFDEIYSQSKEMIDGQYRNVTCAYQLTEGVRGYIDTGYDSYYLVVFDQDGVAIRVDENYIPRGQD